MLARNVTTFISGHSGKDLHVMLSPFITWNKLIAVAAVAAGATQLATAVQISSVDPA